MSDVAPCPLEKVDECDDSLFPILLGRQYYRCCVAHSLRSADTKFESYVRGLESIPVVQVGLA